MPILRRFRIPLKFKEILTLVFFICGRANMVNSWTGTEFIFPDNCQEYKDNDVAPDQPTIQKTDAAFLVSHSGSNPLSERVDCYLTVQAWRNHHRLFIQLNEGYTLDDSATNGVTPCNWTRLEFYNYDSEGKRNKEFTWCAGDDYPRLNDDFESDSNFMSVRLVVTDTGRANFTFVYSSFHTKDCSDTIKELKCNNGRCMPREVRCDFANNCGDISDQLVGPPAFCPLYTPPTTIPSPWWIWIIVAALLLMFVSYWLCWRPGYIPWRLACCRNVMKNCLGKCCAGCCQDCVCRCNSAGRGGSCCGQRSSTGGDGSNDGSARASGQNSSGEKRNGGSSSSGSRSSCCPCLRNRGNSSSNNQNNGTGGKGVGGGGPADHVRSAAGDTKGVLLSSKPGLYHSNDFDSLENGDGGHVREGR